jgi:CRISPR-associated protein Cas5d
MSVKVEVWGPYACFSRPELKTERVSFDVMTPSAARGILDSIYYHPGLTWRIDRIYVLNPIAFTGVRRNEVKSKVSADTALSAMRSGKGDLFISSSADIQQRASLILRDVHYVIQAHFDMTDKAAPGDNPGKFSDIMHRRLENGKCFHNPCFGCREFPAFFREWGAGEIVTAYPDEDRELGLMLYDLDYSNPLDIRPMFFRARLEKGVLNVPAPDSAEVLR